MSYLDTMLEAYIECALWSSTGDNDEPLDNDYGECDISELSTEMMRNDCAAFLRLASEHLESLKVSAESAGHDFWLTRNGHGAGFWDRGYGPIGGTLSEIAESEGYCELYVGDDNQVYAL